MLAISFAGPCQILAILNPFPPSSVLSLKLCVLLFAPSLFGLQCCLGRVSSQWEENPNLTRGEPRILAKHLGLGKASWGRASVNWPFPCVLWKRRADARPLGCSLGCPLAVTCISVSYRLRFVFKASLLALCCSNTQIFFPGKCLQGFEL